MILDRICLHIVEKADGLLMGAGDDSLHTIGMLDVLGFEDMAVNGF